MDMSFLGRTLVTVGLGLAALGAVLWAASRFAPSLKLGRLPGDLAFEAGGAKVYFPLTTMILASLALTFVLWLVGVLRK